MTLSSSLRSLTLATLIDSIRPESTMDLPCSSLINVRATLTYSSNSLNSAEFLSPLFEENALKICD